MSSSDNTVNILVMKDICIYVYIFCFLGLFFEFTFLQGHEKEAGVPLEQSKPHGTAQQLSQINTKIKRNISNSTYNGGTKHTLKYKEFRQAAHLQYITCN